MKKVMYIGGGPAVVDLGEAGQFVRGVARDIESDDIAGGLLGKTSLIFREIVPLGMLSLEAAAARVEEAGSPEELTALAEGETRKSIKDAIAKRRQELTPIAAETGAQEPVTSEQNNLGDQSAGKEA